MRTREDSIEDHLFPRGTQFGPSELPVLFDQYKLFVDSSERLVARRQAVNTFFLSVNTLLLSFVGFIVRDTVGADVTLAAIIAASAAGIVLCFTWRTLVRSFRQLNTGKFAVIEELEKHLPAAVFKAEWYSLGEGKDKKKYIPFTKSEAIIPWVFVILYFLAIVVTAVQRAAP